MKDPIAALEAELDHLEDPAITATIPALRRLHELVDQVDRLASKYVATRARLIRRARDELTWREIGEIFDVSAQRAEAMSKQGNTQPERTPA